MFNPKSYQHLLQTHPKYKYNKNYIFTPKSYQYLFQTDKNTNIAETVFTLKNYQP